MICNKCGNNIPDGAVCSCLKNDIKSRVTELKAAEIEKERQIQNEVIKEFDERRKKEEEKEIKKENNKKIRKDVSNKISNSYLSFFLKPVSSLKSFIIDEQTFQPIAIFVAYFLLFASTCSILFKFTSISFFLGPKGQLSEFSLISIFLLILILDIIFTFIGIVITNLFLNKDIEINFSDTMIYFSTVLVFSIPLLIVSLITSIYISYLSFILIGIVFILKAMGIYNLFLFKTKKFDSSFLSTFFITTLTFVGMFLTFIILFQNIL